MRILYNCYEYPPCLHGGVGTFTKDLAEGLVSQGHNVTVVGLYFDNVLKLEGIVQEVINGVRVIRIPQYRKSGIARIDTLFSRFFLRHYLRQLLKKESFDLVESPEGSGWIPWGVPGKLPLITRLHGGQGFFEKTLKRKSSGLFKLFERMQISRSTQVVAVSEFIGRVTSELYSIHRDIRVIYNGIKIPSIDDYKGIHLTGDGNKMILFYGSVDPKKGVKELIQAFLVLANRGYKISLSIAGKMPKERYNEELYQVIPPNMRGRIVFHGPLDREKELFPLIAKSDICCFPSKVESFGIAPVEAMAFYKPVVFTKLAAGPEVIRDGVDGLLCDPYNPNDIADKIALFLEDPQLRNRCAKSAFNRAWSEFTKERMLENNIRFYQSLIQS